MELNNSAACNSNKAAIMLNVKKNAAHHISINEKIRKINTSLAVMNHNRVQSCNKQSILTKLAPLQFFEKLQSDVFGKAIDVDQFAMSKSASKIYSHPILAILANVPPKSVHCSKVNECFHQIHNASKGSKNETENEMSKLNTVLCYFTLNSTFILEVKTKMTSPSNGTGCKRSMSCNMSLAKGTYLSGFSYDRDYDTLDTSQPYDHSSLNHGRKANLSAKVMTKKKPILIYGNPHESDISHGIVNSEKYFIDVSTQAYSTENLILMMKKISSMGNKRYSRKSNASFPIKYGNIDYDDTRHVIVEQKKTEHLPKIFDENQFEIVDGLIQLVTQRTQTSFDNLSSLNSSSSSSIHSIQSMTKIADKS